MYHPISMKVNNDKYKNFPVLKCVMKILFGKKGYKSYKIYIFHFRLCAKQIID